MKIVYYNNSAVLKCDEEDREKMRFSEMRRLVRGARRSFLTHLRAVFPNQVGKNGQPPLSVLSGAYAQFEWYRGVCLRLNYRDEGFLFL